MPDQAQNGWISAKRILPEPGERVLATDGYAVFEMYRKTSGRWVRPAEYELPGFTITHWMKMPNPPGKDVEE